MKDPDTPVDPAAQAPSSKKPTFDPPPRRTLPFDLEPGYYEPGKLWLFGNVRLLDAKLAYVNRALGPPIQTSAILDEIEAETERIVLGGQVIVCGIHNDAHKRTAVVPLRWGAPRILIVSGGFHYHFGEGLDQEPFRAARLWRYKWDPKSDLAISRRAPDRLPTYSLHNPAVDRLIAGLVEARQLATASHLDPFGIAPATKH